MGQFVPCLIRHRRGLEAEPIGHLVLDDYSGFVPVRARANTWLAGRRT
jgi:hypothetical protein